VSIEAAAPPPPPQECNRAKRKLLQRKLAGVAAAALFLSVRSRHCSDLSNLGNLLILWMSWRLMVGV